MAKKKLKTKTTDIRKLNDADLTKELGDTYRRLFSIRLQKETLQLTNHRELPHTRRQIARLKTIERQRELAKATRTTGAAQ
jgi:large subunit ribosomal protein L29